MNIGLGQNGFTLIGANGNKHQIGALAQIVEPSPGGNMSFRQGHAGGIPLRGGVDNYFFT